MFNFWLPPPSFEQFKSYWFENSLFQAMSPQSIEEERVINETKTALEKAGIVFDATMKGVVKALVVANVVTLATSAFFPADTSESMHSSNASFHSNICSPWNLLAIALYEEIVHRGVIQNGIGYLQQYVSSWIPASLKENYVVEWLSSASSRVVVSEAIFAAMHLKNLSHLNPSLVAGQIAQTVLYPTAAIVQETMGSTAYPILQHFIHNSVACARIHMRG